MNKFRIKFKGWKYVAVISAFLLIGGFSGWAVYAATNISSTTTKHWAWNDILGWIDFYNTQNINVTSRKLTGYATSSAGYISLDCATSPSNNICAQSNYSVINDGSGNLSGWGWNDVYGWISFCGGQGNNPDPVIAANCPGTAVSYRVLINGTTGAFSRYAWNDILGWISFNCADPGLCGTSNYDVETSWRPVSATGTLVSSIFDTGVTGGAQLNSILWHGTLPSPLGGAWVGFQIAASNNPAGPWNFVGGASGTSDGWYIGDPNVSIPLSFTLHNNMRYFRYKIQLVSDESQSASPQVYDVNVNWSR